MVAFNFAPAKRQALSVCFQRELLMRDAASPRAEGTALMPTTTRTEVAGPGPLLAYLLLHHSADGATLSTALGHDSDRISRSLRRLARRGLVAERDGRYEISANRRTAVADYAEGALSLRELVQAGR
jgi:hypothetical protein